MPKITEIKPRRGTAAQWASTNPVLASGEMGLESDTKKIKFGDGTTTWNSLGYAGGEPAIAPGLPTEFLAGDKTWKTIDFPVRTFAELQAAVAAGGTIRIDNNYPITITSQLEITKSCHIIGGDLRLDPAATWSVFNITTSDVTIDTVRFSAGGTTQPYRISARFISAIGSGSNKYSDIRIKGCRMQGNQGENIRLTWCINSSIIDCKMDDFLYAGVLMLSCSDIKVLGNTITNGKLFAPRVDVYGIAATDGSNTIAGRCKNITISGNTVRNIDWEGIDTHGGEHIIITDNIVTGCPRGIALVVGNPDRVVVPVDVIVADNFVDREGVNDNNGYEREGISLFGLSGNLAYGTITGNTIKGWTNSNLIYLSSVDHSKTMIANNSRPHVPWTDLPLDNTAAWAAHGTYPPQYMVDGRTVFLRGLITSKISATTNYRLATMPPVAAGDRNLTFAGVAKIAANSAASATVGVYSSGEIWILYRSTADLSSYTIECSYTRNYENNNP